MNKLRLPMLLPTLPKYDNAFKKGPYKNGNYRGVYVILAGDNFYSNRYDLNDLPREYLEAPYYVIGISPTVLSCGMHEANVGLYIYLAKEENKFNMEEN